MTRRRRPIGMQTLREQNCYYVDKTHFIRRLLDKGKRNFLSRPRRFGKSLFLDTLKELFEGNEALFAGLYIPPRLVGAPSGGAVELRRQQLHRARESARERDGAVGRRCRTAGRERALRHRAGAVRDGACACRTAGGGVLVDEYDKPVLDALETPEVARANRHYLRGLYGVIRTATRTSGSRS